jgi:VanZ family protein
VNEPPVRNFPPLLPPTFWPPAAALWTAAVLALALSPDARSSWIMKTLGDKILHAGAFTVGGIIWIKTLETAPRLTRVGAWTAGTVMALLVGIAIELLQRYVPTRSADARDFLADIVGVLVAIIYLTLVWGLNTLFQRRNV